MGAGYIKALLVTAAATTLAAGCGGTPQPPARHTVTPQPPARQATTAPVPRTLTRLQACQRLRDDLTRHQGAPDIPTLRLIADHVTAPRLAAEARTAVRDIGHTGIALIAVSLLRDDCARAGVKIP